MSNVDLSKVLPSNNILSNVCKTTKPWNSRNAQILAAVLGAALVYVAIHYGNEKNMFTVNVSAQKIPTAHAHEAR